MLYLNHQIKGVIALEEMEHFSTRLTKGLKQKMKVEAAKRGIKTQDLVSNIFKDWLEKNEQKEGK